MRETAMMQPLFRGQCRQHFGFLRESYDYQFLGFEEGEDGISARYKNGTVGVIVSYGYYENCIGVTLVRLVDGRLPTEHDLRRSPASGQFYLSHVLHVDHLLQDCRIGKKIRQRKAGDWRLDIPRTLEQYALALRTCGHQLLRGELSAFPAEAELP